MPDWLPSLGDAAIGFVILQATTLLALLQARLGALALRRQLQKRAGNAVFQKAVAQTLVDEQQKLVDAQKAKQAELKAKNDRNRAKRAVRKAQRAARKVNR